MARKCRILVSIYHIFTFEDALRMLCECAEKTNNQKLMLGYKKYQELQAKSQKMQEDYERPLQEQEESHNSALKEQIEHYSKRLEEKEAHLAQVSFFVHLLHFVL